MVDFLTLVLFLLIIETFLFVHKKASSFFLSTVEYQNFYLVYMKITFEMKKNVNISYKLKKLLISVIATYQRGRGLKI